MKECVVRVQHDSMEDCGNGGDGQYNYIPTCMDYRPDPNRLVGPQISYGYAYLFYLSYLITQIRTLTTVHRKKKNKKAAKPKYTCKVPGCAHEGHFKFKRTANAHMRRQHPGEAVLLLYEDEEPIPEQKPR